MKRRDVDKAITQLLERIDGELAEIRDGLIEVDHRAGKAARDGETIAQYAQSLGSRLAAVETVMALRDAGQTLRDNFDHSRKA